MSESPEATHLRHLLEKQPSVLMRVGRDGTLLACNDAGLSLLGKTELGQVLNRSFQEHLQADQAVAWREFVRRVWASGAGSLECDLNVADAAPRRALIQGVALRNHPDGLDSVLVTVRDISPIYNLEASLNEDRVAQQKLTEAEARLADADRERQNLAGQLTARQAQADELAASVKQQEAEAARLTAALAERERESARVTAALQQQQAEASRLGGSLAEQERRATELASALQERETATARLKASLDTFAADLERQKQVLTARDAERDAERARTLQERQQLEASLREAQAAAQQATAHQVDATRAAQAAAQQQLDTARAAQTAAQQQLAGTQAQLDAALKERQRLVAALDESKAAGQQLDAARAAQTAAQQQLTDTQAQLDAALKEQQRLVTALDETKAAHQQLSASLRELYAERERAANERRQLEATLRERATADQLLLATEAQLATVRHDHQQAAHELRETRAERDRLAAGLDEIRQDRERLTATLEKRAAEFRGQHESQAAELERLRQSASQQQAALHDQEQSARARVGELEHQLSGARTEQARLQQLVDLRSASEQDTAAAAEEQRRRIADLESELARITPEQERVAARLAELELAHHEIAAERDAAAARHAVELGRLQHALAETQAAATEQQARDRQALEALEARYTDTVSGSERTASLVGELRRLADDHDAARAHLERALAAARAEAASRHEEDRRQLDEAEARYTGALAEQQRLLRIVERDATERHKIESDHAEIRTQIQRQLADDFERTMAARERERTETVANLQAELALAIADQRRLKTLLTRAETEQHRLIATHTADRAEADRSLGEALFKKNQIAKTLADQRVELDQWRDTAQELEPLAVTGRLARQISAELHELVAALDDRARFLLSIAALDASYRPEVERLRAEAMRASSLARQIVPLERDTAAAANQGRDAGAPAPADQSETV